MNAASLPPNKHQERSLRTRELLLDATLEAIIEIGYAKTSTSEVCARAGLSRGAQLHQFGSKAELLGHAVEHLADKQREQLQEAVAAVEPGTDPAHAVVDLAWATFSGPLGKASVELFVATNEDDELHERMHDAQRALTRETFAACAEVAEDALGRERLRTVFWLTINLIRGLTIDEMLGRDEARRANLLSEWKQLADRS
jgi:AcrR family transcriptional regulator